MRRPLIAGNWKMHHTVGEALAFAEGIQEALARFTDVDAAIFPPATLLHPLSRALAGTRARLGGQSCHERPEGAFTGEISAPMLADAGCSLVLVGHSERRQLFGESDRLVGAKLRAAIDSGLVAVLCVGESEEQREEGRTREVIGAQLRVALEGVGSDRASQLVIAYEPVWAIGTGRTATPAIAQEAHAFLREVFGTLLGEEAADELRILYGGSVKPDNARALLDRPDVDGGLVGGASLRAESFCELLAQASRLGPRPA